MFEYKLTFLEFGCSNSTYYNCSWLHNDYLVSFYSDYTDNIFQMLICCSWHLNHGHIYVPVVVKMQILMSSWLPDCPFCGRISIPLVALVINHRTYTYALGAQRVNVNQTLSLHVLQTSLFPVI